MSTATARLSTSSQPRYTRGRPAPREESISNPAHDTPSDPLSSSVDVTNTLDATPAEPVVSGSAPRRSTRTKEHTAPEPAPLPVRHQVPRKQHIEFLRAPPDLITAFREARTEYQDAVYAWWYSRPRTRGEQPTPEDWELVKRDPRVQRTGRRLDELDAELTKRGTVVKNSTLTNNKARDLHEKIRDQEHKLNREHYAAEHAAQQHQSTSAAATASQDARPGKRKRAAPARSSKSTSASTSRASTHDTAITTPEPDRTVEEKKECEVEPPRFARKKARVA